MSARMYEDLRDMLKQELNAIVKKGEVTKENLDNIYKLICSLHKTAHLIMDESGNGYSQGYSQRYYRDGGSYDYSGNSYNSYDGRRGRDGDSDGRYSEEYSGRRGRYHDGYSGHDDKQQMVEKLRKMAQETSDQQTKMMIQDCIRGIEG